MNVKKSSKKVPSISLLLVAMLILNLCCKKNLSEERVTDEILSEENTYYVRTDGNNGNSGMSNTASGAWRSIRHACDSAPEGAIIKIGPGLFQESASIFVKAGQTLIGAAYKGEAAGETEIIAPEEWDHSGTSCDDYLSSPRVIDVGGSDNVKISYLSIYESKDDAGVKAAIGIYAKGADMLEIDHVKCYYFLWHGIYTHGSKNIRIHDSYLYNSVSRRTVCDASEPGNLQMRYCPNAEVYNNVIRTENGVRGYGIRARGVNDGKFHDNLIDIAGSFSMEIAHELERNVQIYNNDCKGAISLTREGVNEPGSLGYTVRIFNNILRSTYAVEATRRNIEVDHNYFTNEYGSLLNRVFSDFNTDIDGFIKIHDNVAENVQGGFFWKINGLGRDIYIENNTIYTAGKQDGSASNRVISFETPSKITSLYIRNNVIVATTNRPAVLYKVDQIPNAVFDHNVYQNISGAIPAGGVNYDSNPQLALTGAKPFPYYRPSSSSSFVVGKGLSLGFDAGTTIGRYQY